MGVLSSIASALGVGGANTVVTTANGVADIVERWAPSEEKKVQMQVELNKLVESARSYDPRSAANGKAAEFINVLVDSITRMIRPGITIAVFGGLFGWWDISVKSVDPWIVSWGQDLMAFWFGSRTVLKDLPAFLKALKDLRRGAP
jgi:hypothetical protein